MVCTKLNKVEKWDENNISTDLTSVRTFELYKIEFLILVEKVVGDYKKLKRLLDLDKLN